MTKLFFASAAAAATIAALALPSPSPAADLARPRHHRIVRVRPSVDAVRLGALAPPAPPSTVEQSYGDAGIARARAQRVIAENTTNDVAPYPCDPHVAVADGTVCANVPGRLGYGQGYAFTPDYVTAPQISGADPSAQTSLLAPATVLFLNANDALFGRR